MKTIEKILAGAKWNDKVYGNNTIYLNNEKHILTSEEARILINFQTGIIQEGIEYPDLPIFPNSVCNNSEKLDSILNRKVEKIECKKGDVTFFLYKVTYGNSGNRYFAYDDKYHEITEEVFNLTLIYKS